MDIKTGEIMKGINIKLDYGNSYKTFIDCHSITINEFYSYPSQLLLSFYHKGKDYTKEKIRISNNQKDNFWRQWKSNSMEIVIKV